MSPKPAAETTANYSAVTDGGYQYPGGYLALGESRALTQAEAINGVSTGQLVLTPQPAAATASKSADAPAPNEEN